MRVLVVSHNAMEPSTNMGKTLSTCFSGFSKSELAQFYIQNQMFPQNSPCEKFYRHTDQDALREFLFRKETGKGSSSCTQNLSWLYRWGKRRRSLTYLLRELLWEHASWDTASFWDWVDDFSPDVIFQAAGDYGFLYKIAWKIAAHTGKPLVMYCVDDFYLYNRNEKQLLGRLVHRRFLKIVSRTMREASAIFCICPQMQKAYETLFDKPCLFLPAVAEFWQCSGETGDQLSYIGNLDNRRYQNLLEMGKALDRIWQPGMPAYIDVYSREENPAVLRCLTRQRRIRFHGGVSSNQVPEIMAKSMAVIHVEAFHRDMQARVRLSVSTKIPESLRNGPCLIAYGPESVASIGYVKETKAAYVITEPSRLETGLQEILTREDLRETIQSRARQLAQENHDIGIHSQRFRKTLDEICKTKETML